VVRRNSKDDDEAEFQPRSGRRIRSAEEIEKIMKNVEKFAPPPPTTNVDETTTTTTFASTSTEQHFQKLQQQQQQQNKPSATRVQIHNIRSSLPRPEIEMIYTVYQGN
jgi:hypothetical protein